MEGKIKVCEQGILGRGVISMLIRGSCGEHACAAFLCAEFLRGVAALSARALSLCVCVCVRENE